MKIISIRGFRTILRKIKSGKILDRIGSGKPVYFENPLEEMAYKYIPGGHGKLGKYFAKQSDGNEFNIDFDSSSFVTAVMEGNQISKTRYDKYHLIEGISWNGDTKIPERKRQWAITG